VDVSRQALSDIFVDAHAQLEAAYQQWQFKKINSSTQVVSLANFLQQVIIDLDRILSTNANYLLGHWIEDAKAWAAVPAEEKLLEFNARNQLTMWGPDRNIEDYAAKSWAGLVSDYYLQRWRLFLGRITESVTKGQDMDFAKYDHDLLTFEQAWSNQTKVFPTIPVGSPLAITSELIGRYAPAASSITYRVQRNTDSAGSDQTAKALWTRDVGQLQMLCSLDVTCKGFNTNGWLKSAIGTLTTSTVDLYVKV